METGQRTQLLRFLKPISPATQTFLGLEIGGSKLQLATGDGSGRVHQCLRLTVDPAQGAEGIRAQIESALPTLLRQTRPQASAIGFGGPVNWKIGSVSRSHQIEGWAGFDLPGWLGALTGGPVRVENDANLAALGEAVKGAGQGCRSMFYVTLGSGVGGGLVVDGTIYHGAVPGESEIGHLRLNEKGTTVEQVCSGWAMDAQVRALRDSHPDTLLSRLALESPGHEARHMRAALAANDAAAWRLLRMMSRKLALGLSHVTHLLHPERIVLGGGLSLLGEPLRGAVAKALPRLVMEVFRESIDVRLAQLGEQAVPVGALLLAGQTSRS